MCVRQTMGAVRLVGVVLALAAAGCTIQFGPDDNPPPQPSTITIKLYNGTTKPLDPEIYVGAISGGLGQLFTSANKRTDFGFAGLGLVEAGKEATLSVNCGAGVYIATAGGLYGDDLNAPLGEGQQIVLQEDLNVRCGDIVRFTFNPAGSSLETSYTVEPQSN
ncbi:MAG TPA: hypothetical protein PLP66_04265 [Phycisphaerae bacterium]|nr:hypothetical protein [Phycisphaerae bacterium]HPM23092.1 hypothetical protein [Phycisphaerae bacterium]HQL53284.1 hypothetical protein [Phycisphaerae bacterium]